MIDRAAFKTLFSTVAAQIDSDIATVESMWWHDARNNAGLRITLFAYTHLLELEVEHYRFDLTADVSRKPRVLLDLDQCMTCPYYLHTKKSPQLVLFGSREAVMLALYGDVEKFLKNAPRARQ